MNLMAKMLRLVDYTYNLITVSRLDEIKRPVLIEMFEETRLPRQFRGRKGYS